MGKMIDVKRPDGTTARAYAAEAVGTRRAGVVVIQEWWGVQGQITGTCDKLAAAGYSVLAPDLYDGFVAAYHDTAGAERAMNNLDAGAATAGAIRGAVLQLKAQGGKVGLTGFCLGGLLTALGALKIPEVDAGVAFYGLPSPAAGDPKGLRIPLQGHFANTDAWCTPEAVNEFEAAAKSAPRLPEFHRYDAEHGFMNEERPQFHPASAALAWERMMAFWRKHL